LCAHGKFNEQSKILEPSIIIINYCIIISSSIINAHYNDNCIINSCYNYYIIFLIKASLRNVVRMKIWK